MRLGQRQREPNLPRHVTRATAVPHAGRRRLPDRVLAADTRKVTAVAPCSHPVPVRHPVGFTQRPEISVLQAQLRHFLLVGCSLALQLHVLLPKALHLTRGIHIGTIRI